MSLVLAVIVLTELRLWRYCRQV